MMILEKYLGKGTPPDKSETLALGSIKKDLLQREPELYQSKWWDYRGLHHTEATLLFAAFYHLHARRAHGKFFDKGEAAERFGPKYIFSGRYDKGMRTGMWKARQYADEYGLPYGIYCSMAIDLLMESYTWSKIPLPQQLYSDDSIGMITHGWDYIKQSSLQLASDPLYALENYKGYACQNDYQDWLCGQISLRVNPRFALSDLIGKQISRETAEKHFGAETISRFF